MSAARWQEPNLASTPFVNERPVRRLAGLLWVLFLVVGGAAVWTSLDNRQATGARLARLVQLNTEITSARERAAALEQELRSANLPALNERTEFLNRRLAERSFSWSRLLETLTRTMPRGVRLVRLSPEGFVRERGRTSAQSGTAATSRVELRISAEAEDTEPMLEFVDRLFEHPAFDQPNLSRESEKKDSRIQFELTVAYLPQVSGEDGAPPLAADSGRTGGVAGAQASSPGAASPSAVAGASPASSRAAGAGSSGPAASRQGTLPLTASPDAAASSASRGAPASKGASGRTRFPAPAAPAVQGADEIPPAAAIDRGGQRAPSATGGGTLPVLPAGLFSGVADAGRGGSAQRPTAFPPPAAPSATPGPTAGRAPRFPEDVMPTPLQPYASSAGNVR